MFQTRQTPSLLVLRDVLEVGISLSMFPIGNVHRDTLFWELRESRGMMPDNAKPFPLYVREWFGINLIKFATFQGCF